jgi:hypothetical protein
MKKLIGDAELEGARSSASPDENIKTVIDQLISGSRNT